VSTLRYPFVPLAFREDLEIAEWAQMAVLGEVRGLAPGEPLIRHGQRPDAFFVVDAGEVEVVGPKGAAPLAVAGEGEIVGEMSLCTGEPASATVVARGNVRVLAVPRAVVERRLLTQPQLGIKILQALSRLMAARLRTPVTRALPPLPDVPAMPSVERLKVACAGVMASIPTVHFGDEVEALLDRTAEVAQRPRFLWCWCARGIEKVTLSSVPDALLPWLRDTKVLAVVLSLLLEDLVEPEGDGLALEQAAGLITLARADLPWELEEPVHARMGLLRDVWTALGRRARELAGWERWAELFLHDWRQVVNAVRHERLVRRWPELINVGEEEALAPPRTAMMCFATLDWMASPGADREELGSLRQAMGHAQAMGRLGTGLATWRRQLLAGDASSPVVARARAAGAISAAELAETTGDATQKMVRIEAAGVEEQVLADWQAHHRELEALASRVRSVNLTALLEGTDVLLGMSLAAAGRL
jgi:CRP-like cAMP-binding protein